MKKKAKFWKQLENNIVQCNLCSHSCKIKPDNRGLCNIRENNLGTLYSLIYGRSTSPSADPIEKKPLFHFYPGTNVFSFGSVGCNFKCNHCQNYSTSTADIDSSFLQEISPEEAIRLTLKHNCRGIAWTYNEPTIWHEYTYETMRLAKKQNLYTVYVTNGYIQEKPLRELAPFLDAMNIDVKAFNNSFYKEICNAKVKPVLKTCELAKKLSIHIELTYLVIPGLNDSLLEIESFCKWVVDKLGEDTPVHFTRFHPDYKMTNQSITPIETLEKIYLKAKEVGIHFPYLGNISNIEYENTICPNCGNICIERTGFSSKLTGTKGKSCASCGYSLPVIND